MARGRQAWARHIRLGDVAADRFVADAPQLR
jgi:hypothetical protein